MAATRAVRLAAVALALVALGGCNGVFFQPDDTFYYEPAQFGLWHEQVVFKSGDGTRLRGWFLPGRAPVLGTVVHFHGNAANISNHLLAVSWLPRLGFSVFLFDYRGYGGSEGSPSRAGAIADGVAAIDYVRSRKDVDPARLIVFGQSLGGALAVNAVAAAGTSGVRGLVLEGTFRSYREVVRLIMDDTWFLWPFQYPVAYLLFSDGDSPREVLPQLQSLSVLVVHGENDRTVPPEAGQRLYESVPGPDKTFWSIPHAEHQGIFTPKGSPWREPLAQWMRQRLGPPARPRR